MILGSQLGVGAYRALAEEGQDGVMVSVGSQLSLRYEPFEKLINMKTLAPTPGPSTRRRTFTSFRVISKSRVEESP